jgi:NTE family protein
MVTPHRVHLIPEEIKYIVLEGGGGKGNAFIGALEALQELQIIDYDGFRLSNIKGVAGSSAGAITALLLACGYTPEEIRIITTDITDARNFIDSNLCMNHRPIYSVGVDLFSESNVRQDSTVNELVILAKEILQMFYDPTRISEIVKLVAKIYNTLPNKTVFGLSILFSYLQSLLLISKGSPPETIALLKGTDPQSMAISICYDYGVCPGFVVYNFLKRWIAIARYRLAEMSADERLTADFDPFQALQQLNDDYDSNSKIQSYARPTFQEFQQEFKIDLAVTGSNLETFKSHVFSARNTPDFSVPDAIRISMSLPVAFKPVVIRGCDPEFMNGIWVDGGILNNLPLRALRGSTSKNTLGLRLEMEKRKKISSFWDFFSVWPMGMAFGAGESLISQTWENYYQNIVLDTEGLSLLSFKVDSGIFDQVNKKSKEAVMRALSQEPDYDFIRA